MRHFWKGIFQNLGCLGLSAVLTVSVHTGVRSDSVLKDHAVVELFTSQGCSSCPPADAFLGELAKRQDVTALTLPVDYWDYLGWKDTLASRQFSNRQRSYAAQRGDGSVYTPQIVVNGTSHVVGSSKSRVNQAIADAAGQFGLNAVSVSIRDDDNTIVVETGAVREGSRLKSGTVWLASVKKEIVVSIGRGENTGRSITYYNVVRQLVPVGQWMGESMNLRLPKNEYIQDNPDFFVALIQARENGQIIGVARVNN